MTGTFESRSFWKEEPEWRLLERAESWGRRTCLKACEQLKDLQAADERMAAAKWTAVDCG